MDGAQKCVYVYYYSACNNVIHTVLLHLFAYFGALTLRLIFLFEIVNFAIVFQLFPSFALHFRALAYF